MVFRKKKDLATEISGGREVLTTNRVRRFGLRSSSRPICEPHYMAKDDAMAPGEPLH